MGPPVSNLKITTAIFLLPKDRLRCRRTRESLGERRSPAGCAAQSVPGVRSPAARKLSMFARWQHLHRPDPCLAQGPGQPGELPGGRVTPNALAPGSVLGPYPPRHAWSYASDTSSAGLGWYCLPPQCGALCFGLSVGRGYGGPQACSNSTWPLPPGR